MTTVLRRRSPGWVRALDRATLHALAVRFARKLRADDLTASEDWLWGAVLSELEYRHRNNRILLERCWCELCAPYDEWSAAEEHQEGPFDGT